MEQLDRLRFLLDRLAAKTATPAELDELTGLVEADREGALSGQIEAWAQEKPMDGGPVNSGPAIAEMPFDTNRWRTIADRIMATDKIPAQTGEDRQRIPVNRVHFLRRWGWAAAAILLLAAGTEWWRMEHPVQSPTVLAGAGVTKVLPGRDGAVLTLADGSQIVLDSLANGVVTRQNGQAVTLQNNSLVYGAENGAAGNKATGTDKSGAGTNTITTPKGRQFKLILPDGTRVWINAGSTLQYPVSFHGAERRVQLSGEAYFDVAKNPARPFRVEVPGQMQAEVLGTEFNINAYANEQGNYTTLVSGAVRVSLAGTGGSTAAKALTLQPGQQVAAGRQGLELVSGANVEKAIAWRNGYFNFDGSGLREMMRQLERWYDLDVVYEGNVPDVRFFGEMSRSLELSDVLAGLERSNVHFRLEAGRRLVVLP